MSFVLIMKSRNETTGIKCNNARIVSTRSNDIIIVVILR